LEAKVKSLSAGAEAEKSTMAAALEESRAVVERLEAKVKSLSAGAEAEKSTLAAALEESRATCSKLIKDIAHLKEAAEDKSASKAVAEENQEALMAARSAISALQEQLRREEKSFASDIDALKAQLAAGNRVLYVIGSASEVEDIFPGHMRSEVSSAGIHVEVCYDHSQFSLATMKRGLLGAHVLGVGSSCLTVVVPILSDFPGKFDALIFTRAVSRMLGALRSKHAAIANDPRLRVTERSERVLQFARFKPATKHDALLDLSDELLSKK